MMNRMHPAREMHAAFVRGSVTLGKQPSLDGSSLIFFSSPSLSLFLFLFVTRDSRVIGGVNTSGGKFHDRERDALRLVSIKFSETE